MVFSTTGTRRRRKYQLNHGLAGWYIFFEFWVCPAYVNKVHLHYLCKIIHRVQLTKLSYYFISRWHDENKLSKSCKMQDDAKHLPPLIRFLDKSHFAFISPRFETVVVPSHLLLHFSRSLL